MLLTETEMTNLVLSALSSNRVLSGYDDLTPHQLYADIAKRVAFQYKEYRYPIDKIVVDALLSEFDETKIDIMAVKKAIFVIKERLSF